MAGTKTHMLSADDPFSRTQESLAAFCRVADIKGVPGPQPTRNSAIISQSHHEPQRRSEARKWYLIEIMSTNGLLRETSPRQISASLGCGSVDE